MSGAPRICEVCTGTVFTHQVCAICGWRPGCPVCGRLVTGRKDRVYCSDRCKKARWDENHAPVTDAAGARRVLTQISEPQLRDLLRGVMVERERARAAQLGSEPRRSGRLRVRWGA